MKPENSVTHKDFSWKNGIETSRIEKHDWKVFDRYSEISQTSIKTESVFNVRCNRAFGCECAIFMR